MEVTLSNLGYGTEGQRYSQSVMFLVAGIEHSFSLKEQKRSRLQTGMNDI